MGRPLRLEYPGALYHITARGNERREIFSDETDRRYFLEMLKEYHERFDLIIHSYVLMSNHYHLVIETPIGNIIKIMHGINSRYTGYYNRKYGRIGHLFQGRYKAILVDKESYLVVLSRYVHLNPVRAGMVDNPQDYQWSSYNGFILKSKAEDWIQYDWILGVFSKNGSVARKKYREYVNIDIKESPLEKIYAGVILGTDKFIADIKDILGSGISREVVSCKLIKERFTPEDIIALTAKAFDENESILTTKNVRNVSRNAAIYLVKKHTHLENTAIGELFGGMHYSSVSKTCTRFQLKLDIDKHLQKKINDIMPNAKT